MVPYFWHDGCNTRPEWRFQQDLWWSDSAAGSNVLAVDIPYFSAHMAFYGVLEVPLEQQLALYWFDRIKQRLLQIWCCSPEMDLGFGGCYEITWGFSGNSSRIRRQESRLPANQVAGNQAMPHYMITVFITCTNCKKGTAPVRPATIYSLWCVCGRWGW